MKIKASNVFGMEGNKNQQKEVNDKETNQDNQNNFVMPKMEMIRGYAEVPDYHYCNYKSYYHRMFHG